MRFVLISLFPFGFGLQHYCKVSHSVSFSTFISLVDRMRFLLLLLLLLLLFLPDSQLTLSSFVDCIAVMSVPFSEFSTGKHHLVW